MRRASPLAITYQQGSHAANAKKGDGIADRLQYGYGGIQDKHAENGDSQRLKRGWLDASPAGAAPSRRYLVLDQSAKELSFFDDEPQDHNAKKPTGSVPLSKLSLSSRKLSNCLNFPSSVGKVPDKGVQPM